MKVSEWTDLHKDVKVLLETEKIEQVFVFKMQDVNSNWKTVRKIPFRSMPFEQEEIVIEDYICSILEQMHHEIVCKREESEVKND